MFRCMSRSSKWPMRMLLPCCTTGGSFSMRRILSSASPLPKSHEFEAWIRAETETLPPPPAWTVMLPEPEMISRSTGPETWRVRSKCPVAAAQRGSTPRVKARSKRLKFFKVFILPPRFMSGFLLQDYPLAFLKAGEQFGFGSVGDAHGHG